MQHVRLGPQAVDADPVPAGLRSSVMQSRSGILIASVLRGSMGDFKYHLFPTHWLKYVSLQAPVTLSFMKNRALKDIFLHWESAESHSWALYIYTHT